MIAPRLRRGPSSQSVTTSPRTAICNAANTIAAPMCSGGPPRRPFMDMRAAASRARSATAKWTTNCQPTPAQSPRPLSRGTRLVKYRLAGFGKSRRLAEASSQVMADKAALAAKRAKGLRCLAPRTYPLYLRRQFAAPTPPRPPRAVAKLDWLSSHFRAIVSAWREEEGHLPQRRRRSTRCVGWPRTA